VVSLRDHLLDGRLTLEEFSERVDIAYGARTGSDLVRASADLPDLATPRVQSRRKPTRFTGAFFGHIVRRGRIRLQRRSLVVGAFADVDFDLREAEIDVPTTTLTTLLAFGNADIYVPEGVDVDVGGVTFFGHRRDWGRDFAHASSLSIRVRVLSVLGTVDIWRVPHQMRGNYGEILRQLREQQRQLPDPARGPDQPPAHTSD
jgi:Domain of unknown function (DUF1707)